MTRSGRTLWNVGRLALVILMLSCVMYPELDVVARVARRGVATIDIQLENGSSVDVLLISPKKPNRQLDEERCTLLLSTKVQEWILPYAFTPDLVEIKAGETRTVSV